MDVTEVSPGHRRAVELAATYNPWRNQETSLFERHADWDEVRTQCPISHSDELGGFPNITGHPEIAAIAAIATDPTIFSSTGANIVTLGSGTLTEMPPIDLDPPRHTPVRKMVLPSLSPRTVQRWAPAIQANATAVIEGMEELRAHPEDNLLSLLLHPEDDVEELDHETIKGFGFLMVLAGVDTTWSLLGSALLHLATHDDDRRRLAEDPSLMDAALEKLLRMYSPVYFIGRPVLKSGEVAGVSFKPKDRLALCFSAADRDPRANVDAGKFIIDRKENRHVTLRGRYPLLPGSIDRTARVEDRPQYLNAVHPRVPRG